MAEPGRATERNWNGAGANDNWSTAANWGGTAPTTAGLDGIRFGGSVRTSAVNDFSGAIFDRLYFNTGAAAFTLSGNSIQLNNASNGIRNVSSVEQRIDLDIELSVAGTGTTVGATGGNIVINGVLSGVGGISLTGANVVKLNGANTFSGGITVGASRSVRLGHTQAAGTGTLTQAGGTLTFGGSIGNFSVGNLAGSGEFALTDELGQGVTLTLTGAGEASKTAALNGLGALKVALQPGGKQILTAANTYTGGTTVDSGTLELSGASGNLASTGALTVNGGTLLISRTGGTKVVMVASLNGTGGEIVGSTTSGGLATDATLIVNTASSDRFDGALKNGVGTLLLAKSGAGALTLGGVNTYTGATTVSGGTLNIVGSLTASNVTVETGGALGGNGGSITNSVTVDTGGALNFSLDNPSETNLTVGSISLDSNVDLKLTLDYAVQPGDIFTILEVSEAYTGVFATVNGAAFGPGNTFSLQHGMNTYDFVLTYGADAVTVAAIPEPHAALLLLLAGGLLAFGRNGRMLIGKSRQISGQRACE